MNKNSAIGSSWDEARVDLFTPEEIVGSDLRAALIGELIKVSLVIKSACKLQEVR